MKNSRMARPALLFAAVCAVLTGSSQARILTSDLPDWVGQNDVRHFGAVLMEPTLEQLLEPFNFEDVNSATYFISHNAMAMQLEGRGLSKTGRGFVDTQQVDRWYSAAEDRSVVCVTANNGGRYGQTVYVMAGKVRRADATPLP